MKVLTKKNKIQTQVCAFLCLVPPYRCGTVMEKKAFKGTSLNIKVHWLILMLKKIGQIKKHFTKTIILQGSSLLPEILNMCFTTNLSMSSVPQHHV